MGEGGQLGEAAATEQLSSSPGATVELPCRLAPAEQLTWSRPGGRLPARARQLRGGAVLRLEEVRAEDSGRYVCTSGRGREQYVTLTVQSEYTLN